MMENPLNIFNNYWEKAKAIKDPNAGLCTLATVSEDGHACVRTLVLRWVDEESFAIFINQSSPKWSQLKGSGHSSAISSANLSANLSANYELHVFWPNLMHQFRVRGELQEIPLEIMKTHWKMKPYDSKILDHYYTHVNAQSSEINSREELLNDISELKKQYPTDADIPFSPIAKGINLKANYLEHWQGSPEDRLHHRHLYLLQNGVWEKRILVP